MQSTVIPGDDIGTSHIHACRIEPQLSDDWTHRARDLLRQHADVFSRHDLDVGSTAMVRHIINLMDDAPFKKRSRPIASHIRALLDAWIIRESSSPYASPIVLVRKKNGSLRLTVHYRKLNQKTIKDAYALPRIDDAFSCLSGAKWFSVMDLKSGYYQVEMEPSDREKTAFVCPLGFYEYTLMPQGERPCDISAYHGKLRGQHEPTGGDGILGRFNCLLPDHGGPRKETRPSG